MPQAPDDDTPEGEPLKIDQPVICRVLTDPKHYAPFLQFCCGKDRREESEVMLTVHNLWAGTTQIQQIAVVLEKDAPRLQHTGERPLVAVCTIATTQLGIDGVAGVDPGDYGAIVGIIGTDLAYRKHTLQDGKTRPGVALLSGALKLVEQMFGGAMPFVRANVLPTNEGSKPLFDEHCFENFGQPQVINERGEKEVADNLALFRPPQVRPSQKRRPTWSLQ
ncbi:MAG: hypothetical protein ACHQHO_11960 [Solirubrobacterales bacterium]